MKYRTEISIISENHKIPMKERLLAILCVIAYTFTGIDGMCFLLDCMEKWDNIKRN